MDRRFPSARHIQSASFTNTHTTQSAFLTAKGSLTLLDKMNGALAELIYDGTVDQLKAKWHA